MKKEKKRKEQTLQVRKGSEHFEKKKTINSWEYLRGTPSEIKKPPKKLMTMDKVLPDRLYEWRKGGGCR